MALKDWRKTGTPNHIIWTKKDNWVKYDLNYPKDYSITIRNKNIKWFTNKAKAIAFAKAYMRKK